MIIQKKLSGQTVQFEVVKRRGQKRIIVRPKAENYYIVSAPKYCSKETIENMIDNHREAILSIPTMVDIKSHYKLGETITIFNQAVTIIQRVGKNDVYLEDNYLIVQSFNDKIEAVSKLVIEFLKSLLLEQLEILVAAYQFVIPNTDLEALSFRVKLLKSKFGSCQPSLMKITMNLELVHYPIEYLKFIFLHEISHLKHRDHSQDFYRFFGSLYPNYKASRLQLNRLRTLLFKEGFQGLIKDLNV